MVDRLGQRGSFGAEPPVVGRVLRIALNGEFPVLIQRGQNAAAYAAAKQYSVGPASATNGCRI